MNYEFLRYFVPIYFAFFIFFCLIWRWLAFFRVTGKNPIIFHDAETAHGYLGRILAYFFLFGALIVVLFCSASHYYQILRPLETPVPFQIAGVAILLGTLLLIATAQAQMGASWRIGIDNREKTQLVHRGLYKFSRNPIYLGMELASIGFFLVLPSAATLILVVVGHITLQIEIRLEEAHLLSLHGESFREYCDKVRRWI